jgi:oxaloacetate decarboxylase alpha subunit
VYQVEVAEGGELSSVEPTASSTENSPSSGNEGNNANAVNAPLSGTIVKLMVSEGQQVQEGDVILLLEAMKMETEVRSAYSGAVSGILVKEGDAVQSGQPMLSVG